MEHTPGPWKAESVKSDRHTLVYKRIMAGKEAVAFAGVYKEHSAEANARLIAAAPELLEVLKGAESVIRQGGHLNGQWLLEAHAAIAKATQ